MPAKPPLLLAMEERGGLFAEFEIGADPAFLAHINQDYAEALARFPEDRWLGIATDGGGGQLAIVRPNNEDVADAPVVWLDSEGSRPHCLRIGLCYAHRVKEALIAKLRDVLAADEDVEVAALFGSAARDRLTPESDVDVYVRLRPHVRWTHERSNAVVASLERACRREIDLIIEDRNDTSTVLRMEVARHGVLLFERVPGAWTTVRAAAMVDYADMEPFMRITGAGIRRKIRERAGG